MSGDILILRPQPGADETAQRVHALGLRPVCAPLFTVRPLAWRLPDERFDAVMLTSANAARHGGDGLTSCLAMPCYAVGGATADAARAAGFTRIVTGDTDGDALVARMVADGMRTVLWLSGAERTALAGSALRIVPVPVYSADPVAQLPPDAADALGGGTIALLHSARAAALFAELAAGRRGETRIAALSGKVARAAGDGWAAVAIAGRPADDALLELAAQLCQTARR